MRPALFAVLAFAPLAACSHAVEAVKGPDLTPVGYPSALVPQKQEVLAEAPPRFQRASANSLWRPGARAFFIDQRAAGVGDILTVNIRIDDRANMQNSSTSLRTSGMTAGVPRFFGLESSLGKIFPSEYNPAEMIQTESESNKTGAGSITRAEQINLSIAAVVTAVLPNGNMVIQGTQEVRTNAELRQLTVAGIVRPEDISARNTIQHTQIAEARISYGGRGDISRVQKTPAGQSLLEKFSPF